MKTPRSKKKKTKEEKPPPPEDDDDVDSGAQEPIKGDIFDIQCRRNPF